MKKLILILFIFSLITINSEAEPISRTQEKGKTYLPFAPKPKTGKHRTWKQKPVRNLKVKFKNCLKW